MIQKRSCSLSTRLNWNFYDMVKIRLMINVNFFLPYIWIFNLERQENFADNLPKER